MAESRKSTIEMTSLDICNEKAEKTKQEKSENAELGVYEEYKEPVPDTSLDEVKAEQLPDSERSPTLGVTLNVEMTYLCRGEKKKLENTPEEDPDAYKTEKPKPCTSSDGFYAERLPASESSLTPGVTLNKPDEKEEKYLEIIDDVTMQQENLSDEGPNESRAEQPMSFTFVKFEAEGFPAQKSTSASAATKNVSIEMTYLHKKDEKKVDKYHYMTLDQDSKKREDLGRYTSLSVPCMSSVIARKSSSISGASPASENLNTDDEYDEVMTENENSSGTSPDGYEEPDVVNSVLPPVQGSHSQRVTSAGETSVHQELQ